MVTLRQPQPITRQILIVEDDEDTAEVVTAIMSQAGYTVMAVDRGQVALHEIHNAPPDLVLLDLGLPDMNGLEVLRQVRANSLLPLIVLSGYTEERDKVNALEAGADDYLAKPFSPEELVARIGALLRRVEWTAPSESKLIVRNLEVDLARRVVLLRGKRLQLTPIEYGLLVALMRRAGQILTHDELLRTVWGDQYTGDFSVLRVNVSRLRQKLDENPRAPSYIVTVAGQGYTMPLRP
ncbi:MAG: DNA-binding response regulator [Phototrophicales bacterium]|nr:MAG: DNA-binding response regulator [Phototrophicales bacterium]